MEHRAISNAIGGSKKPLELYTKLKESMFKKRLVFAKPLKGYKTLKS
jgi:hypothetical protein